MAEEGDELVLDQWKVRGANRYCGIVIKNGKRSDEWYETGKGCTLNFAGARTLVGFSARVQARERSRA